MTTRNNGGPAFPRPSSNFNRISLGYEAAQDGMSLRDWFAGMVLQAIVTAEYMKAGDGEELDIERLSNVSASEAYAIADAMIDERGD